MTNTWRPGVEPITISKLTKRKTVFYLYELSVIFALAARYPNERSQLAFSPPGTGLLVARPRHEPPAPARLALVRQMDHHRVFANQKTQNRRGTA